MQDLNKVLYNHSGSNIPGVFDRNIKLTYSTTVTDSQEY